MAAMNHCWVFTTVAAEIETGAMRTQVFDHPKVQGLRFPVVIFGTGFFVGARHGGQ